MYFVSLFWNTKLYFSLFVFKWKCIIYLPLIIARSKDIKLITNAEVRDHLYHSVDDKMLYGSGEFPWIRSAVMRYLDTTPASQLTKEKWVCILLIYVSELLPSFQHLIALRREITWNSQQTRKCKFWTSFPYNLLIYIL
jgi:hypothetical protein